MRIDRDFVQIAKDGWLAGFTLGEVLSDLRKSDVNIKTIKKVRAVWERLDEQTKFTVSTEGRF
jgi:hypothetical protein